jgi:hypothetical protein
MKEVDKMKSGIMERNGDAAGEDEQLYKLGRSVAVLALAVPRQQSASQSGTRTSIDSHETNALRRKQCIITIWTIQDMANACVSISIGFGTDLGRQYKGKCSGTLTIVCRSNRHQTEETQKR